MKTSYQTRQMRPAAPSAPVPKQPDQKPEEAAAKDVTGHYLTRASG